MRRRPRGHRPLALLRSAAARRDAHHPRAAWAVCAAAVLLVAVTATALTVAPRAGADPPPHAADDEAAPLVLRYNWVGYLLDGPVTLGRDPAQAGSARVVRLPYSTVSPEHALITPLTAVEGGVERPSMPSSGILAAPPARGSSDRRPT